MPKQSAGLNFNEYIVHPFPTIVLDAVDRYLDEHYKEYSAAVEKVKEPEAQIADYEALDNWYRDNKK